MTTGTKLCCKLGNKITVVHIGYRNPQPLSTAQHEIPATTGHLLVNMLKPK
ncbi:uncharacterized protein METZ01_LOCUS200832 [marine metagenome]|uniref:Uncharacterized protein n=1 Tax=marine metagenome TaxID=408172 RepID=A0A382EBB6_9ZZZZ